MTEDSELTKAEPHTPTAGMKAEAKRGLAWRKEFNRGGTQIGVARARDIINAKSLPIETVKRMYSFFSRHEVDKKAEGFERGEEGYPSAGRVAWALWGGDAGFSWSKKLVESHDAKKAELLSVAQVFEDESLLNPDRRPPAEFNPNSGAFEELGGVSQEDGLLDGDSSYDLGETSLHDEITMLLRQVLQTWLKANPNGEIPAIMKGSEYGESVEGIDAMSHLLMAYREMIDHPDCQELLEPLMEIIHAKEAIMIEQIMNNPTPNLPVSVGGDEMHEYGKVIRYEDGQYCVYSTTGRGFGCYLSEEQANERLAQMESFAEKRLRPASDHELFSWHNGFHKMDDISNENKIVHDLVEDELVRRGLDGAYDFDQCEAYVGTVLKQDEARYTLGPAYVPEIDDAHGEYTDSATLQRALWDWVKKGDRRIFLQHSDKQAGEMVEVLTWPFAVTAELNTPNQGVTKFEFPDHTPFLGVIWEDWAWELIKAGELRGYSIGGRAKRVDVSFED